MARRAQGGVIPAAGVIGTERWWDRGAVATASEALTHGYTTGFLAGAGMLLVAAVVAIVAVDTRRTQNAAEEAPRPRPVPDRPAANRKG